MRELEKNWLKNYEFRRKMTARFKHFGQHEFLLEYYIKTQKLHATEVNTSIELPNNGNVCFTKLDGITKIKPKTIILNKDEWISLLQVNVEPEKDCGFYVYYNKNETRERGT